MAAGAPARVLLAVVGAHLRGLPLNHQLTSVNAAFVVTTKTAPEYKLYALPNTSPPKPGLVRVGPGEAGAAIEVEVWDVATADFGTFMTFVPSPLCIGTLALEGGKMAKGFLCEPFALQGAQDISGYGGWKAFLAAQQ